MALREDIEQSMDVILKEQCFLNSIGYIVGRNLEGSNCEIGDYVGISVVWVGKKMKLSYDVSDFKKLSFAGRVAVLIISKLVEDFNKGCTDNILDPKEMNRLVDEIGVVVEKALSKIRKEG